MKIRRFHLLKPQVLSIIGMLFWLNLPAPAHAEYSNYLTGNSPPPTPTINYPAAATGGPENTAIIQGLLRDAGKKTPDAKKKETTPSIQRQLSNIGTYVLPSNSATPTYSMTLYPIAATGPQPKEVSKEECLSKINEKLREITDRELNNNEAADPNKSTLRDVLNNQTERSFIKFSRAFIRAGYYRYSKGESSPNLLEQLKTEYRDLISNQKVTSEDVDSVKNFFDAVNEGRDVKDQFDNFAASLVKFAKTDDPTFHISPSDLLVMKSIITYTRSPNKRKMTLRDRLLDQMRQVFPKRNFEDDDLGQQKSYHDRYQTQSFSTSFKAAKKAFADNAKQVITAYVKTLDKRCQQYFIDKDGSFKINEVSTSCNTGNYLHSLFSADPLSNIEPLISYLTQEDLSWESDQFLRVAGVKAKSKSCSIEGNNIKVTLDIENLPQKFTTPWKLTCPTCGETDPLINKTIEQKIEETRTISFTGDAAPKELFIETAEIPNKTKVVLDNCQKIEPVAAEPIPLIEEKPASETPSAPVAAPEAKEEEPIAKTECEDPTQEKVGDKCVPQCKESEYRDDETGKCVDNDVDSLTASNEEKDKKEQDVLAVRSRSGRASASLPQPRYLSVPKSSFYIKAGFN